MINASLWKQPFTAFSDPSFTMCTFLWKHSSISKWDHVFISKPSRRHFQITIHQYIRSLGKSHTALRFFQSYRYCRAGNKQAKKRYIFSPIYKRSTEHMIGIAGAEEMSIKFTITILQWSDGCFQGGWKTYWNKIFFIQKESHANCFQLPKLTYHVSV